MAKKIGNGNWVKGKSGNPATQFKPGNTASVGFSKRKKIPNLEALIADILSEQGKTGKNIGRSELEILLRAQLARGKAGDTKAAALILDRAYGKAKQFIEQVNRNEIDVAGLDEEELLLLAKIQEKHSKKNIMPADNPEDISGEEGEDDDEN